MRLLWPLLVITFLISCSDDLDFEQINDAQFTQNAVVTGVFFEADQTQFLDASQTNEIDEVSILSSIDFFSGEYIQNNLVKVVFEFEIENTFDRDFQINIIFLNDASQETANVTLTATQNTITTRSVTFEGNPLNDLKTSSQIILEAKLLPGSTPIDINSTEKLTLKSTAIFTLITS